MTILPFTRKLSDLLDDLSEVIGQERAALLALDTGVLDEFAARKVHLVETLSGWQGDVSPEHSERLSDLQKQLRYNLVLLVHARDHVKGVVGLLTGVEPAARPSKMAGGSGFRIDLRG